jgi:hypothetical protein
LTIVVVIAELGRGNLKLLKQFTRMARILSRNRIDLTQHLHRPEGDVFQVADRRSDHVECSGWQ